MEEFHELTLTETKRTSEVQIKELTSQQSKQVLALEASEKEVKSLKDEVKELKVICNDKKSSLPNYLVYLILICCLSSP